MAKVPETMPDGTDRAPELTDFLQAFVNEHGISQSFIDASDHPGSCRCDKCLAWWSDMLDPDDPNYGPFTQEEIELYRKQQEANNG